MIEAQGAEMGACVKFFWEEIRAIEVVVEEVAAELGGEDPLKPIFQERLERSKADLTYLNQFLEVQDAAVEDWPSVLTPQVW